MLRITRISINGSDATLKLEGKILAEWAVLLQRECRALIRERKQVMLDFSRVTYIDLDGIKRVKDLRSKGVHIINPPDFIEALLDQGGKL